MTGHASHWQTIQRIAKHNTCHCVFLRSAMYTARRKASSMPTSTAASQGGESRLTVVLRLSLMSATGSHCGEG